MVSTTAIPSLTDPNAWFDHYDIDQSGNLDKEEVISGLFQTMQQQQQSSTRPHHPHQASADSIRDTVLAVWPAFDRDGSGTIDRSEFCGPGGMGESLRAAVEQMASGSTQQQQPQSASSVPVAQTRALGGAFVPSAYVPSQQQQQQYQQHPQPSAPPSAPSAPPAPWTSGGGDSGGLGSAGGDGWECQICTLVNLASATRCKACGETAPPGVGGGGMPMQSSQQQTGYPTSAVPPPQPYQVPPAPQQYQPQPPQPYQPQHPPSYSAAPQQHQHPQHHQPPQPQLNQQPQMQTFRVLVPPGTQPGQRLRVETGGAEEAILVAVPDRLRWRNDPSVGAQPFFDVQVPKRAPVAVAVAGSGMSSYANGPMGSGGGGCGGAGRPVSASAAGGMAGVAGMAASLAASVNSYAQSHAQGGQFSHSAAASSSAVHPMASSSSSSAAPTNSHLAPIAPQHVATSPTTLILKERTMSYSGDDASIKDSSGATLFSVKAEMMTLSQRRYMCDTRGQRIGQLRRKKTPGLNPTVYVGTPADEKKCAVKMSGLLNPMNCNAKVCLGDAKIGKVSGNWRAKKFTITIDGNVVATVARKRTAASYFMGADSYCIDCQAGVDLAFVSLIAIALDELFHDEKGGMNNNSNLMGSIGPMF